jgi:two-component system cell cycle response regulator CpdR
MLTLVVDDDSSVRTYVQAILHAQDHMTLQAEDGRQALEIVKTLDGSVDLIITDLQMPGMDGLSFAHAVRSSFPRVPIILMSGYGDPGSPFEFLEKPFSWATLLGTVRSVLASKTRVA